MTEDRAADTAAARQKRNLSLALNLSMIVAGMVMLSFASVPLYSLFCKVTGFGGKPLVAEESDIPDHVVVDREMVVRFNADVHPDLNWQFQPLEQKVTVKLGEDKLIAYHAKNLDSVPETGIAVFNVTPAGAAAYFNKIQCFCFENQTLKPGEDVNMPVSFFIDPEILNNPELKDLQTVTLSYTFFKSKKP